MSGSTPKRWMAGLGALAITGLGLAVPGVAHAEVSGPYAGAQSIAIAKGRPIMEAITASRIRSPSSSRRF